MVEFIVAYYQKGRFAVDRKTKRAYAANGTDVIPSHWSDLVGEEFVGTPFAEYPDAEEQYKKRANAKEIEWGKGPPVSTTHVFTGLALIEDPDTQEVELQPFRLSLQRTAVPAVRKWMTLIKSKLRNRPWWGKSFVISTYRQPFDQGSAYLPKIVLGRDTTPEEREAAQALAQATIAGRVADNAEGVSAADTPVEPSADGALEV